MRLSLVLLIFFQVLFADYVDDSRFREFSLRYGGENENIVGDFTFAGASVMCVKDGNGECDWDYDGYLFDADTKYLNEDATIPINSSSAVLNLPPEVKGENIRWAGLYWQGHIHGDNPNDYGDAVLDFNKVIFKTPDGVKHTITAPIDDNNKVNFYAFKSEDENPKGFRFFYQCFADVTELVKGSYSPLNRTFTVGSVRTTAGEDEFYRDPLADWGWIKYGHWGGWSLIVVYERDTLDQDYKNISVFDGFKALIPMPSEPEKSIEIPISGFLTPSAGEVSSRLLFFGMGGEKKIERDWVEIYKPSSGNFVKIANGLNPENNVLNGSVTFFGNYLDSSKKYVPGFDLDLFNSSSWMEHSQNSTKLKFSAVFQNRMGDQTFTGVMAFSTKINSPRIDNFLKYSNRGGGYRLRQGDRIEYYLDFNNSGTEKASDITIFDNFLEDNLTAFIERDDPAEVAKSIRLSADNNPEFFYCLEGPSANDCDAYFDSDQRCDVNVDENGSLKGVYCTFKELDVGHRRVMRFRVRIREGFLSNRDHNVLNQAHSRYKNALTGEWVDRIGKSNIYSAGVITGVVVGNNRVDIIDDFSLGYVKDKGIKTKIASKDYSFDAVYIDDTFSPTPYYPYAGATLPSLKVIYRIKDINDPSYSFLLKDSGGNVVVSVFNQNDKSVHIPSAVMPSRAIKNAKISMKYLDYVKLFFEKNNNPCFLISGNVGNIKGMPQCVNSSSLYREAFGEEAYNRCIVGYGSPCSPSHHGVGNAPYDHEYGCYECTADALNSVSVSTDDFAIRPFKYEFDLPSKVVAGENFNFKVLAKDFSLNTLNNYNETINSSFKITYKERKTVCNTGVLSLSGASFNNGVLLKNTLYNEIGILDINISEIVGSEFASIDSDDTPLNLREIPSLLSSITFIPNSFEVNWNLNNISTASGYTYYSDDPFSMGGKLKVSVKAKSYSGNVAKNYDASCYAKDTNLTITFSADGADTAPYVLKWKDLYHPSHSNSAAISFSLPVSSSSFKINIPKNYFSMGESNNTIMINFKREVNKAREPLKLTFSKVKANDEDISGESSHNDVIKFYYARVHSPDYPNILGDTADDLPFYYEVYCKNCDKSVFTVANGTLCKKGDLYWYINSSHTSLFGSVNSVSSDGGSIVSDLKLNSLDLKAPSLPHNDTIHLTPSMWLVYSSSNPSATSVDFDVTFLNADTKWAGKGKLGHIVDEKISVKKNRKISW